MRARLDLFMFTFNHSPKPLYLQELHYQSVTHLYDTCRLALTFLALLSILVYARYVALDARYTLNAGRRRRDRRSDSALATDAHQHVVTVNALATAIASAPIAMSSLRDDIDFLNFDMFRS